MRPTPSKATPAKGGGLLAFGFTKKTPGSAQTPKTVASSDNDEPVEVVSREVTSTSVNAKRTQAQPLDLEEEVSQKQEKMEVKAAKPGLEAVSKPEVASKPEEVSKPKVEQTTTPEMSARKRRVILDEEEDELDDVPSKPVSAPKPQEIKKPTVTQDKTPVKKSKLDEIISENESESDYSDESESDVEEEPTPKAKKAATKPKAAFSGGSAKKSPPSGAAAADKPITRQGVYGAGEHEHDNLPWFQERKDSAMRPKGHPEYDESTLFVPSGYLEGKPAFHVPGQARKITDAMRVWWEFFSVNADTVIAFKVGKFYEMYHSSADVAVKYCDLLYMKGETAHCGFPEIAWAKNMSKLVNANYRVARIEQTETPEAMMERTGKKSGMVRREVCQVLSPGTMTLSVRDCGDGFVPRPDGRIQLVSVCETASNVGVCILDATTGKFRIGEFANDEHRSGVRALLAFESPAEIVYVPTELSQETLAVLRSENKAMHTTFPAHKKIRSCDWKQYFTESPDGAVPTILDEAASTMPLASQAILNCLKVLKRALVDDELVSMGRFSKYTIPTAMSARSEGSVTKSTNGADLFTEGAEIPLMKLDAQALHHLEIISNITEGTKEGTLLEYLDRTKSPFGARLFKEWVTRPLASAPHVRERQNAIKALLEKVNDSSVIEFRRALQQCPDLERNLSKIHAIGLAKKKNHPDTRAVIYGAEEINKGKIETLCATLTALKNLRLAATKLSSALSGTSEKSTYLEQLAQDLTSEVALDRLEHFDRAFDAKQAKRTGSIEPREGVAPSYDAAVDGVNSVKNALQDYLTKMKKQHGFQISYFSPAQGKQRFQMEVQENVSVPRDWMMASKRKGYKRYISPELKDLTTRMERAEQNLAEASVDVTRTVFAEFDKHKIEWLKLVKAAGEIDCLLSLALVSCDSLQTCLPEIVDKKDADGPFLELIQARHPCVAAGLERLGKNSFIPNDTLLTGESGRCMLLTGPNMGGKSTLLRQTCLAVIVAQMGCFVQADSYRGTIVDAIFTRVGASDRILEGQSTFFVELSETATILQNATADSLVILDELGRGTSTFDGTAIAHAVVNKLLAVGCRTMFATHYHSLVREVGRSRGVSLGHMACVAEKQGDSDDKQDVTFLYKLQEGASDRSYGLNVARLARLPESIIQRAHVMSQRFEHAFERHIRKRILEEVEDSCRAKDLKRLRIASARAECFVTSA